MRLVVLLSSLLLQNVFSLMRNCQFNILPKWFFLYGNPQTVECRNTEQKSVQKMTNAQSGQRHKKHKT